MSPSLLKSLSPLFGCLECAGQRMEATYAPSLVLFSILIAVVAAYTALDLASRVGRTTGITRRVLLGSGALMMGIGIWAMHFVGMLAFSMEGRMSYGPGLTALSMGAAILGSWAALFVVSRSLVTPERLLAGGVFMGLAISAMHYLGMAAAIFTPAPVSPDFIAAGIQVNGLGAVAIGAAALGGLGLTLLGSLVDLEHRRAQRPLTLLADASAVMGRSLDIPTIAEALTGLAAPSVVDLYEEDGTTLRRVAVCYPEHREREVRYQGIPYARDESSDCPLQRVLRTAQPEFLHHPSRAELERLTHLPECLTLTRDAQARAVLIVPLQHRERVLGTITVFSRERPLGPTERALVQELGRRAGSAVENARLYHEAQEAIRVRDEFLSIASHELLDISRIRLGRLELHPEPVDLGEVVRDVVAR